MKEYPSQGDAGRAERPGGQWTGKDDPWFRTVGALDELNSAVGWSRAACAGQKDLSARLLQLQRDIFAVGAVLGGWRPFESSELDTASLEADIQRMWDALPPVSGFVLPGGCELACRLHLARTICRRAERRLAALAAQVDPPVHPEIQAYMNRLSDWLFAAARWANHEAGVGDDCRHDAEGR
ncbi:MAG: cob(I)yrinic acid a,c-diamide adenosyltransferase [Phycisphaerae bacterium]|nr:cob(I)yrinic acid a,c-diamide adenosyltransferase [Phycisphaerae bacterium]